MAKTRKGRDIIENGPPTSEKERAVDMAVSQIERQFGKGAIMKLGSGGVIPDIRVIPSGSLGLDICLGVGGVPQGRITEIFGPESSGQDDALLACYCRGSEARRHSGFCRR